MLLTCGLDRVRSAMHGIASLLYDDASSDQLLVNLLITGMPIEEVCLFPSVCVCVCVQFCCLLVSILLWWCGDYCLGGWVRAFVLRRTARLTAELGVCKANDGLVVGSQPNTRP